MAKCHLVIFLMWQDVYIQGHAQMGHVYCSLMQTFLKNSRTARSPPNTIFNQTHDVVYGCMNSEKKGFFLKYYLLNKALEQTIHRSTGWVTWISSSKKKSSEEEARWSWVSTQSYSDSHLKWQPGAQHADGSQHTTPGTHLTGYW